MHALILLHGALGAASSMAPLSSALNQMADIHTLDFSGHGAAEWPDAGFAMEVFEKDVLRLMEDRGLQGAHIFGYSMGGFAGLRLAKAHPGRILSVTTLATKFDWTEETCAKESRGLDADAIEAKVPRFAAALDALHTGNGWRKVVAATRTMLEGMHRYRFSPEDLSAIAAPVRLMVGDRDKMVRIEETAEAYRAIPGAELAVLPGTPHPLEAADTALLAAHIRSVLQKK